MNYQKKLYQNYQINYFKNIQQAYIHDTQPSLEANLLFQVSGRNTRNISLFNNDVDSVARQKIEFAREVPLEENFITVSNNCP